MIFLNSTKTIQTPDLRAEDVNIGTSRHPNNT